MKLPASDVSISAGPTISSGRAMRGISWMRVISACASAGFLRTMSVSTVPGESAFTRMRCGANSAAIARVAAIRPALPIA